MQVVVAEHGSRLVAELAHVAQHRQRLGAAVDEIADEPEPVLRRIEGELRQELAQLVEAALHIADRVRRHCCRSLEARVQTTVLYRFGDMFGAYARGSRKVGD